MKYNYQIMYFSNSQALESNLLQDWRIIIKNIRRRQDLYHQLVFNFHKISQKQFKTEDQGVATSIVQNKDFICKIKQQQIEMKQQEEQIIEKYQGLIIPFQNCIKLMGRIGAQILQLLKTASNKVRSYDDCAFSRFNLFKTTFIGLLTQREKIDLENTIKVVLDYCKQKMNQFLTKVQKNCISIQNRGINQIYQEKQRKSIFFQIKKDYFRQPFGQKQFSQQKIECFQSQKYKITKTKTVKNEVLKQKIQYKSSEKHLKSQRPLKTKFKLFDCIYNIVLLSKRQPNEELVGNLDIDTQKIYLQLFARNKQNINQILSFRKRHDEVQQKHQNFENKMKLNKQLEDKVESFTLKIKKQSTEIQDSSQKEDYFHFIATETQSNAIENNQQQLKNQLKTISMTRNQFNGSPQIKEDDFARLNCKINKQLLNSIKNDSSKQHRHQSIKGRLPDIKRGSLVQKINQLNYKTIGDYRETIDNAQDSGYKQAKRRQSFFRQERIQSQRKKMILKNVQVGLQISNKKGQRFCKQELTTRQRKKTDTTIQSTIYMRRTINKFIDNKLNVFF